MKIIKYGCFMFILLFISCMTMTSAKFVYDESIPIEQSSWINPMDVGTITGYNGIPVRWSSNSDYKGFFQIPAGDTLLELDINANYGSVAFKGKNILFRYTFEAGKQYLFWVIRRDGKYGLDVASTDIAEEIRFDVRKTNLVEFVPFLNTN